MVPWIGFPLNVLINRVEPTSKAKYVAFQSLYDPKQMPEARYASIPFPYVEGLRIDEAMHPLTLPCFGMYAGALPLIFAMPIALGSWWALLVPVISTPVLIVRILDEERALGAELAGYKDYLVAVPYRLVPRVW